MVDATNKTASNEHADTPVKKCAEIKLVVSDGARSGAANSNGDQPMASLPGMDGAAGAAVFANAINADSHSPAAQQSLTARQATRRKSRVLKFTPLLTLSVVALICILIGVLGWQSLATSPYWSSSYTRLPVQSSPAPALPDMPLPIAPSAIGSISKLNWATLGQILQALFLASVVLGVAFWAYAVHARRRYIYIDKIGILISDSPHPGQGDARFIPWGCLTDVEVVVKNDPQMAKGAMVEADSPQPKVVFHVDDGSSLEVGWHDIVACTESGAFVNALKTFAPFAIEDTIFPGTEQITNVDNHTYTQLWFKYYSKASERQRTGYLAEGDKLHDGRYEVAGQLGGGGQGMAYLAVDTSAEAGKPSEIVLKEYILPVHRGEQVLEATIEKLHKEAEILRSIDHPNIVKIFDEFIEDQRGYLVMEYVAGSPLKRLVVEEGPQPEKFVIDIALQACDVLECLHGRTPPVVHRDLTPDNLILEETGTVKLVDFNVAHQLESAVTATVVGKHCYIPPEQFRGRPTPRSDVYALGGTLYFLLTGHEPEPLTVSRPRNVRPEVSQALDDIIAGCTVLDESRRVADAAELRACLLKLKV